MTEAKEEVPVMEWLTAAIADELPCDIEDVDPDKKLSELGADSLDVHALIMTIEEEYDFAFDEDFDFADHTVTWWALTIERERRRPRRAVQEKADALL